MTFLAVRSYDNYITANLELTLLKQAGINCHLKDEYTVTIDPLLSPALGGMNLMVEAESFDQAKSILAESDARILQTIPCPRCRATSLELVTTITRYFTWGRRIKSLLLNGQEHQESRLYRCTNCLSEYKELPGSGK